MDKEKIAHDLALIWVNHALAGNVKPLTDSKKVVDEYQAVYDHIIEKLNRQSTEPTVPE